MLGFTPRIACVWLLVVMTVGGLPACLKKARQGSSKTSATDVFHLKYFDQNPFAGNDKLHLNAKNGLQELSFGKGVSSGLNHESLWALAQCKCSPAFAGIYLNALVKSRGVVPQPLVPAIREEIRNKPALAALLSLPGRLEAVFGIVFNLLINDKKVNDEIRNGLNEKISKSLPAGSEFVKESNATFDLFPSPIVNLGDSQVFAPRTLNINDQASKWAFVMSLDNLWRATSTNSVPIGYKDHGLQLYATALTLSEWKYALGLDKSSVTNNYYGGLAIDPLQGVAAVPSQLKIDSTNPADKNKIISGTYTIKYPSRGTIDLAISINETWERNPEEVKLDEQARLWTSAAMAYSRLRPESRSEIAQSVFAPQTGMLPDNAHTLALAFLPGLGAMLDGPFIDAKTLLIRDNAVMPGSSARLQADRVASLVALNRLARALLYWSILFDTMTTDMQNKDRLSPDLIGQIKESQKKLKDALRLTVQSILDKYVKTQNPHSTLGSITFIDSLDNPQLPRLEIVAESLSILAFADQTIFKSDTFKTDFQIKIIGLYHAFAADYLANIAAGSPQVRFSTTGALWSLHALEIFSRYPTQLSKAKWLEDAKKQLESAVSDWDAGFK